MRSFFEFVFGCWHKWTPWSSVSQEITAVNDSGDYQIRHCYSCHKEQVRFP